jgi:hypothetical protein
METQYVGKQEMGDKLIVMVAVADEETAKRFDSTENYLELTDKFDMTVMSRMTELSQDDISVGTVRIDLNAMTQEAVHFHFTKKRAKKELGEKYVRPGAGMGRECLVAVGWVDDGDARKVGIDLGFYGTLPNVQYRRFPRSRGRGKPIAPKSPVDIPTTLQVSLTAILSSTVLASAIRTWIQGKRRKVTITVSERSSGRKAKLVYEGPKPTQEVPALAAQLEHLMDTSGTRSLQVAAYSKAERPKLHRR